MGACFRAFLGYAHKRLLPLVWDQLVADLGVYSGYRLIHVTHVVKGLREDRKT